MASLKEKSMGPFQIKAEDITKANGNAEKAREPQKSSLASEAEQPRKIVGAFSEDKKKKKKKKPAKK